MATLSLEPPHFRVALVLDTPDTEIVPGSVGGVVSAAQTVAAAAPHAAATSSATNPACRRPPRMKRKRLISYPLETFLILSESCEVKSLNQHTGASAGWLGCITPPIGQPYAGSDEPGSNEERRPG